MRQVAYRQLALAAELLAMPTDKDTQQQEQQQQQQKHKVQQEQQKNGPQPQQQHHQSHKASPLPLQPAELKYMEHVDAVLPLPQRVGTDKRTRGPEISSPRPPGHNKRNRHASEDEEATAVADQALCGAAAASGAAKAAPVAPNINSGDCSPAAGGAVVLEVGLPALLQGTLGELCGAHAQILEQLRKMQRTCTIPGVIAAASSTAALWTSSTLYDESPAACALDGLRTAAAAAAASSQSQMSGEARACARCLAALILLTQAARCLRDYGPLCAHLFMQHSIGRLPSLAAPLAGASGSLRAAVGQVGSGSQPQMGDGVRECCGNDHPKQLRLTQLLLQLRAESPVSESVCLPQCVRALVPHHRLMACSTKQQPAQALL